MVDPGSDSDDGVRNGVDGSSGGADRAGAAGNGKPGAAKRARVKADPGTVKVKPATPTASRRARQPAATS